MMRLFLWVFLWATFVAWGEYEGGEYEAQGNRGELKSSNQRLLAVAPYYVPMPVPIQPLVVTLYVEGAEGLTPTLYSIAAKMKEFIQRVSRKKVQVKTIVELESPEKRKGKNVYRLILKPGYHSHVPIIGNAITAKHELFHQFGSGHANTRLWNNQTRMKKLRNQRDPFDVMTLSPGQISLNAPHIHMLKWFSPTEEAYLVPNSTYTTFAINTGSHEFKRLKSLFYVVPDTKRRYWFSYVRVNGQGWASPPGFPGTGLAIHTNSGQSTFFEGFIKNDTIHERTGLRFQFTRVTRRFCSLHVTLDPLWQLE